MTDESELRLKIRSAIAQVKDEQSYYIVNERVGSEQNSGRIADEIMQLLTLSHQDAVRKARIDELETALLVVQEKNDVAILNWFDDRLKAIKEDK